jgi:hypothetical protein
LAVALVVWVGLLLHSAALVLGCGLVAGALLALRAGPRSTPRWSEFRNRPWHPPSLAHLVWPIALLPISGLLTAELGTCPNGGFGYLVVAAASFFAPPMLLAGFVLTLRAGTPDSGLRIAGAIALALAFLASCVWAWLVLVFSAMAGC